MEWLDRVSAKKGVVGIEVLPEGLAVAAKGCFGKSSDVDLLQMIRLEDETTNLQKELDHFVHKHKISKRLCHIVLTPKDYQLLLVEAPEVPDEDLREAIRWKIKDLITMPVEKAVVDVFPLPADANKTAKRMVYAVVSNLERIQALIDLVNESGLTLSSIDIGEMAMRNVSCVVAESLQERGVGIVRISEGEGVVSLYKEGNLYLSRQFKLNYSGGLLDELPVDALALEVQRSLDYYERQMGMAPPAALYICGESVTEDKITVELTRSLTVPTKFLSPTESMTFDDDTDEGMMQVCLGALGGVYREDVLQ
ncbi:MAG: hypothetical protein K6L80_06030 [Agarilytica sp.]